MHACSTQGSKFHLSVSLGQVSGFSAGQLRLLILLSIGQPGSRQAPSLVSARHILVSDFNGIPLIQSRQAWQFLLWSPLKQLLSSVHYTTWRRFRNAGRPPLSSVLGGGDRGISRCYCADWLLSSCGHMISRSSGQSARVVRVVSVCVFFV